MNQMSFGDRWLHSYVAKHYNLCIFCIQVAQKTQNMEINRTDAIFEVYTDLIVKKKLTCDKALLWVFSQSISEFSV